MNEFLGASQKPFKLSNRAESPPLVLDRPEPSDAVLLASAELRDWDIRDSRWHPPQT